MAPNASRNRIAVDLGGNWMIYWGRGPIPAGSRVLGTVTRGFETGALLQMPLGNYAIGNARAIKQLDRSKVDAALSAARAGTHGGPGRGGGRMAEDGATATIRKQIMLDQASIDALTTLGEGNLSLGIRRAARRTGAGSDES